LRELDYLIRQERPHQETTTTFETQEIWKKLGRPNNNNSEINNIRRSMKYKFQANSGKMKLSTIHSFKGWEADTLFLIIEEHPAGKDIATEELIYTGITRFRRNLIIINRGNTKYHEFFKSNILADGISKIKI
jgi:superfamily I DNA/RNA helicase